MDAGMNNSRSVNQNMKPRVKHSDLKLKKKYKIEAVEYRALPYPGNVVITKNFEMYLPARFTKLTIPKKINEVIINISI